MIFLNYPFLKLDLPFWFGHALYACIGIWGIYLFGKWAYKVLNLKSSGNLLIFILLGFILIQPNLHVWTSLISKEVIVFWSISAIFYSSLSTAKRWYLGSIGVFLLVMLRPHVAFMLLTSAIIVFILDRKLSLKLRLLVFSGAVLSCTGLFYLMLKISKIRYFDWSRIQHYNEFSVLSLKGTSGYVPMLDYNYVYKLFSLNFRPLFFDAYNAFTLLASLENIISLLFVLSGLLLVFKNFKTLVFSRWMKVSFLFFIIASVLYIERYSNLGLFMRTKMMYMPFLFVAITAVISQSMKMNSLSHKLIRLTTVPLSLQYLLRGQPRYMSAFFEVLCVSSGPVKGLEEVAKREGVKVQEVEMTRQITPFKDLKSVWKLYKLFKKEKPTIVHTHTPKAGIVGMLAANLAGVPVRLHTVAGLPLMEAQGLKRFVLDTVEKLTYSFATKVYPNSKGLEEFILSHRFINESKVKMIGNGSSNGIDISFFNPSLYTKNPKQELRAQLGISKEDFVFVFVGRLVCDKGINELVKAFNWLTSQPVNRSTHYKLLLVGPLETELDPLQDQTLNEIENNPTIITTGFQPDVRPYFAISNALVFPSYREGFPNVVMQAGAMGLPSIVTDINGCNEIIEEGKNGLIIPPKDAKALQEKMLRLVVDEQLYKHLASNSREMITSRYEQKLVWEALLEEYKRLLVNSGQ